MSTVQRIEPPEIVGKVEVYVHAELADAEKYENRTPLDEPGIYSLHRLAADVYAAGFEAGERSAFLRADRERQRQAARKADA